MQDFGFNWLDNIIVAIMAVSIIMGIWRGLMREIMSLLVWILATVVATLFSPMLGGYLDTTVTQPEAQLGVSFLILFIVTYLIGMLLRLLFLKIMGSEPSLKGRILGGLFGIVRGLFFITVVGFLLAFTTVTQEPIWQQSRLVPMVQKIDVMIADLMPGNSEALLKNLIMPIQRSSETLKSQSSSSIKTNDNSMLQAL